MAKTPVDRSFGDATAWREEAERLRELVLGCRLVEEMKWGQPCYTFDGKNIVLIQRMKDYLALLFLKGALLRDPDGILELPGPNSRVGRRIRFTGVQDVVGKEAGVKALVREAVEAERSGKKVEVESDLELPEELLNRFDVDPDLKTAFDALTPGRQRAYSLYFSQAKQSKTRAARIDKCRQKILDGKGPNDR